MPPDDPRVRGTVAAIERELMVDGLVRRYRSHTEVDGLPPGEGVFLPCSFWLADSYTLQNRHAEACALFERLLSLRNDVGLLAEEYDPRARRQVGNFPQAFSHRAARSAASRRALRGPEFSIRGPKSALALRTRGGSRVPELGTLGSVRGALSNERPLYVADCLANRQIC